MTYDRRLEDGGASVSEPGSQIDRLRDELATYRLRYPIDDELPAVHRLELAVERRSHHRRTLEFEVRHLRDRLAEVEAQIRTVDEEIGGSERGLQLLIGDLLDRIRARFGEAWSPAPVLGFRLWRVESAGLYGARERWASPRLAARCLAGGPRLDVPHDADACGGAPPCGIYATKRLGELLDEHGVKPGVRVAIGVVAMRGKVVEHERGFRAAAAEVEALALVDRARAFLTADPVHIESAFEDPEGTLRGLGVDDDRPLQAAIEFLDRHVERSTPWTLAAS